jgi:hypothetical protein
VRGVRRAVEDVAECDAAAAARDGAVVTVLARRPYTRFVEHKYMGRMIANEDALLLGLQQALGPDVLVVMADTALHSLREQLQLVAHTDLLVGMHGAGLAHGLFLPPHAGASRD